MVCVTGKASSKIDSLKWMRFVVTGEQKRIGKFPYGRNQVRKVIDYKYSHTAVDAPTKKWNLLPHPMNTSWLYSLFSWAECIRNDIVQISSLDLAAFALGPGAIPSPCEQAQASHLEDERPFEGGPQWFQPSQMRPQICEGANWK